MQVSRRGSPRRPETSLPVTQRTVPEIRRGYLQKTSVEPKVGESTERCEEELRQGSARAKLSPSSQKEETVERGKGSDFNKNDSKINVNNFVKTNSTKPRSKDKTLKILSSNTCGFKSKKGSIQNILSEQSVDVACFSETHCELEGYPKPIPFHWLLDRVI